MGSEYLQELQLRNQFPHFFEWEEMDHFDIEGLQGEYEEEIVEENEGEAERLNVAQLVEDVVINMNLIAQLKERAKVKENL